MKNFSIKKLRNLFSRKDNNYSSDIEYNTDIDYDICVCTCPNILNENERTCYLPVEEFLNTIIIRYIFTKEYKDIYKQFKGYIDSYKITNFIWFTEDGKYIFYVSLSSFEASKIIDINNGKENRFVDILTEVNDSYKDNIEHYDFDSNSFDMIENTHKNFRKNFYQYSNVSIDILGYTWLDKEFIGEDMDSYSISQFNYIYLIIDVNYINEFSSIEKISYEKDNKVILKIRIIDFVYLINDQDYTTLSVESINTIRKIIKLNELYMKYLYDLIDTDYILEDNGEDTDDKEEEIDTDKFIDMIDEIIKNS